MYCIVKFVDESDAPGIVCTHWINQNETSCLYPNVRTNEARDKLLRKLAEPKDDWSSCRVKVLHKYNSFNVASQNLRLAEDTSNLDSEEDICSRPRKRTKANKKYPGEESEEECLPQSPEYQISRMSAPLPYPAPPKHPSHSSNSERTPASSQTNARFKYLPDSRSPASSQAVINARLIAWMADISTKVENVHQKLDLVLANQAKLLKQQEAPEKIETESMETLGSLPTTDDESFVHLNQMILKEKRLQNLLIKILISVGGKDMRCHIHNMLKRLLTDEVAELYTRSGKSTIKNSVKKPFFETEVSKSIFFACQRSYKECATEMKIKEAVGDWLSQAKVRRIRRIQRNEKKYEEERVAAASLDFDETGIF